MTVRDEAAPRPKTLGELLDRHAERFADRQAIASDGGTRTYAELRHDSRHRPPRGRELRHDGGGDALLLGALRRPARSPPDVRPADARGRAPDRRSREQPRRRRRRGRRDRRPLAGADEPLLRNDAGYLYVTGRLKEIIISGGENVSPEEVEAALAAHPAVIEAAVFGVPDSRWGEAVAAEVVVREPVAEDDLAAAVTNRLARFTKPRRFFFVDHLPRTTAGKLRRIAIRDAAPRG